MAIPPRQYFESNLKRNPEFVLRSKPSRRYQSSGYFERQAAAPMRCAFRPFVMTTSALIARKHTRRARTVFKTSKTGETRNRDDTDASLTSARIFGHWTI